jgi:protein-disulfide isomerase
MDKMANARQRMRERKEAEEKRRKAVRFGIIGGLGVVVVVVIIIVAVVLQSTPGGTVTRAEGLPPHFSDDGTMILMNSAEGVPTVDIYYDYQCPGCGSLERNYGKALEQLAEENKIELRLHTMTFLDQASWSKGASTNGAIGAACADYQGMFADYHLAVFNNQPDSESDSIEPSVFRDTIPEEIGMTGDTLTEFQECYDGRETVSYVNAVNKASQQAGVTSTPTVDVNGTRFVSGTNLDELFVNVAVNDAEALLANIQNVK